MTVGLGQLKTWVGLGFKMDPRPALDVNADVSKFLLQVACSTLHAVG